MLRHWLCVHLVSMSRVSFSCLFTWKHWHFSRRGRCRQKPGNRKKSEQRICIWEWIWISKKAQQVQRQLPSVSVRECGQACVHVCVCVCLSFDLNVESEVRGVGVVNTCSGPPLACLKHRVWKNRACTETRFHSADRATVRDKRQEGKRDRGRVRTETTLTK